MRLLADLPDDDVKWLDERAKTLGKSRASLLRDAVATYKAQSVPASKLDWLEAGFGAWARHGFEYDPKEYDRLRRAEWTRPWDDDYEEVRAESPECFDEHDDHERAHYLALMRKAASRDVPDAA